MSIDSARGMLRLQIHESVLDENPSGSGGLHPAWFAVHESFAELVFEGAELLAQRWLRDPGASRRFGQRSFADDGREILKLTQIHGRFVS